jgi:hypothetical protein
MGGGVALAALAVLTRLTGPAGFVALPSNERPQ